MSPTFINNLALIFILTFTSKTICSAATSGDGKGYEPASLLDEGNQAYLKRSLCNTFGGCGGSYDDSQTRRRRSLCNTFGGCGSKRAMQIGTGSAPASDEIRPASQNQLAEDNEYLSMTPALEQEQLHTLHSKANLIAEILNDLVDYLKTSGKYKRGRYFVLIPKQRNNNGQQQQQAQHHDNNALQQPEVRELQIGDTPRVSPLDAGDTDDNRN